VLATRFKRARRFCWLGRGLTSKREGPPSENSAAELVTLCIKCVWHAGPNLEVHADVRTAARRTELDTNHEAKASRIRRIYSRASSAESAIA
jgi:hypothetical protein